MKTKIGFDFDGTIGDTVSVMCDIATEHLDRLVLPSDITHYGPEYCLNISKRRARELIDELLTYDRSEVIEPYPHVVDFLLDWHAAGNELVVITTRSNEEMIYPFFDKYLPGTCVCIYSSRQKSRLARDLQLTHFIDDCISNIIDLANCGVNPIIFDQPYNKLPSRSLLNDLCQRIDSWLEMRKLFLEALDA